jgi:hypothetical protein
VRNLKPQSLGMEMEMEMEMEMGTEIVIEVVKKPKKSV